MLFFFPFQSSFHIRPLSLELFLSLPLQISKPHGHAIAAADDVVLVLQMHSLRPSVCPGLRPLVPPLRNRIPRGDRDDAPASASAAAANAAELSPP